ncbi:hypothetical protein ACHAXH_001359, partial [Discostella pseudostelligera]
SPHCWFAQKDPPHPSLHLHSPISSGGLSLRPAGSYPWHLPLLHSSLPRQSPPSSLSRRVICLKRVVQKIDGLRTYK